MWKKTVSVVLVIFLLEFASITAFAHTAEIEIDGENRYKAIRLTPQIYNAANRDLSDLLIKDSNGENVPYFINAGSKNRIASRESTLMELINSYLMDDSFYFDYKLAAARNNDIISTSIEFATGNTNFAKEVDLYGSYDNINWEFVQKDKIYSIDGKSKLTIEFAHPQKFTHYRLALANNLEQISFDTVNLVYSIEMTEETYFIETIEPRFNVESENRRTNIVIEGLKNLRLCDITIHTDSMFKRNADTPQGARKEIFNLSLNDTSYSDTTIPLNWQISSDETYIITIADADDKPIQIDGITVRYYADEVVFEGNTNEAYMLEFGADSSKTAPVYDIERYKNEILKGKIDKLEMGEIAYTIYEIEEIPPERDYRLIFNIVIIVITLLLGTVIILKLKKK